MKYIFESPVLITCDDDSIPPAQDVVNDINYRLDHEDSDLSEYLRDDLEMLVSSITMQVRLSMTGIVCRTTCEVVSELKPGVLNKLTDYISGQFSDGWGECFEQVEFSTGESDFFANFWNDEKWSIDAVGFSKD